MRTNVIVPAPRHRVLPRTKIIGRVARVCRLIVVAVLVTSALAAGSAAGAEEALRACATTPDLGSLVRAVGGDRVDVTVFTKPTEDPHFTAARPSFVKALNECGVLVVNGLDLEIGWVSLLLRDARNPDVLPGAPGHVDASAAITPMDIPAGPIDRSMGDVHPRGNPHYLLDPLNGVRVARLLRDRLGALRPDAKAFVDERTTAFERRVGTALVGDALAAKYDVAKLMVLAEHDRLDAFLREQGDDGKLAGWLGAMAPYRGVKAVDDHPIWAYFARRFGLDVIGHLEPKPGLPPTTRHLEELIGRMREEKVPLVLASAYYDPRHAEFAARSSGATVVRLANLVGARPGTDDYVAMIDYDVREVVAALRGARAP